MMRADSDNFEKKTIVHPTQGEIIIDLAEEQHVIARKENGREMNGRT